MNYDNLFFLVYQGGQCGEFLADVLNQHPGLYRPRAEYEPNINKIRTHDIIPSIIYKNLDISEKERNILNNILKNKKLVFRTHYFTDYQSSFPGSKIIEVKSKKHKVFFGNLYSIKVERYRRPFLSVEEKTMAIINQSRRLVYTKNVNVFSLDIDKLFFSKDKNVYNDLCKFIGTTPNDIFWESILEYHQKNINLLLSMNLDPYQTDASIEQLIQNYLKILETAKHLDGYHYEPIIKSSSVTGS